MPQYLWMPPICLGVSEHMGVSRHTGGIQIYMGCQNIWGIQTYKRHPNIWGCTDIQGVIQTCGGHPDIQGTSKYMGCPDIQGVSNHIGTSKYMGVYRHIRGIQTFRCVQTYGVIQIYRGHPKYPLCNVNVINSCMVKVTVANFSSFYIINSLCHYIPFC